MFDIVKLIISYKLTRFNFFFLCVVQQRTDCKAVVSVLPGEVMGPEGFQLSVTLSQQHLPRMWVENHPDKDSQVCFLAVSFFSHTCAMMLFIFFNHLELSSRPACWCSTQTLMSTPVQRLMRLFYCWIRLSPWRESRSAWPRKSLCRSSKPSTAASGSMSFCLAQVSFILYDMFYVMILFYTYIYSTFMTRTVKYLKLYLKDCIWIFRFVFIDWWWGIICSLFIN